MSVDVGWRESFPDLKSLGAAPEITYACGLLPTIYWVDVAA